MEAFFYSGKNQKRKDEMYFQICTLIKKHRSSKSKIMKLVLTLLSILLIGIEYPAQAFQTKLKISVYSVNDGSTLSDVKITLINNNLSIQTNKNGVAEFKEISNPIDVLSIEKEGFEGQTVFLNLEINKLNESSFMLTPTLGEVEVTAQSPTEKLKNSGYFERKEKSVGKFLSEEDINNKNPYRVTDLFTGTSGIKLERIDGILTVVTTRQVSRPGKQFESNAPCPLKILIDGSEMGNLDIESLDSSLDVSQITAVEIYNSPASTPVQFNRFAPCGVILIWTK